MRAKTVNENIGFKRGSSVKSTMEIGNERLTGLYEMDLITHSDWMMDDLLEVSEQIRRLLELSFSKIYFLGNSDDSYTEELQFLNKLQEESNELPSDGHVTFFNKDGLALPIRLGLYESGHGKMIQIIISDEFRPETELWFGGIGIKHFIEKSIK